MFNFIFFQNSNFNSSFSKKLVPQFDSQFKSMSQELEPPFIGLAYQGKIIVFRFIIEYSSLRDFGP
jgi:hypothetical protein